MTLAIPERANTVLSHTGTDTRERCSLVPWFDNYPTFIEYRFNSRGFRDQEWPDDLESAVWCVGDSFTVGIGQPESEIWCQRLGRRAINISMDGASNEWILQQIMSIQASFRPQHIVAHWSFTHRRQQGSGLAGRLHHVRSTQREDNDNFESCVSLATKVAPNIIHTVIPDAGTGAEFQAILSGHNIYQVTQIDVGRDHYHYGPRTAQALADYVVSRLL